MLRVYHVRWSHNGHSYSSRFYTDYHAEQFARALRGNGLIVTVD